MVTTIRIPDDLHKRLKEEAEKRGLTINAVVILALWERVRAGREKEMK